MDDTITSRGVLAESLCDVTNGSKVWLQLPDAMRQQWLRQADLIITHLAQFGHVIVHKDRVVS